MTHFLLAPDSFKGSLSAIEVCAAMQRGIQRAKPNSTVQPIPLADGGEGTLEAICRARSDAKLYQARVQNPLGQIIDAQWARLDDKTALIEMAQSSGLTLIAPAQRDALRASSFGLGQTIKAALEANCRHLLIGIGGSASSDGGAGMLSALGARFLNADGQELGNGGAALNQLSTLDLSQLDARLKECRIEVLCDVSNPLCGTQGAAQVFAPQKGALPAQVQVLAAGLERWAQIAHQKLGRDNSDAAGAGAAGGVGFALLAFAGAQLVPGIERVLDIANFDAHLERAACVLSGEGSLDAQTLNGKTLAGVCRRAQSAGVPVLAFAGRVQLSGTQLDELGLLSAFSLANGALSLQECVDNAGELLSDCVERAVRLFCQALPRD